MYNLHKERELYADKMESGVISFPFRTFIHEKIRLGRKCLQESRWEARKL